MQKIDQGIKDLQLKHPNMKTPQLNWGLRSTRYFIEFPITEGSLDIFGVITSLEQLLTDANP